MNRYYREVSPAQLKQDLELSGFRVLHVGENYSQVRSTASKSMAEAAATATNSEEDLFVELNTGAVVSK